MDNSAGESQRLLSQNISIDENIQKPDITKVSSVLPLNYRLFHKRLQKNETTSKNTRLGSSRLTKSLILGVISTILLSDCESVVGYQESANESNHEMNLLPALIEKPERKEPEIMPCGTIRTLLPNEEMLIESPNFSQKMHYPNSLNCDWTFQFPGRMAKISCPNFHLTEFLCFDNLEIHGANGIMNRYCGSMGPKDLIISEDAKIIFKTSAFFGNIGFRCSIVGLDEEPEIDGLVTPVLPQSRCLCGISNPDKKVVMGEEAELNEFPWQAGLVRKNGTKPFCGGSLINSHFILTAAHCVVGRTPYNLEIILNVHNTEVGHEGSVPLRRSVEAIIPHRRYTSRLDYDVALIKMDEPIDLSHTSPICLPQGENLNNSYSSVNATVSGWGLTSENGELSPVLRKAAVQTMSHEECLEKYSSITDRMLCAAAPGVDACQGDSGGPLVYESSPSSRKYTQIGIVSWGIGCARPNKPGVYTRVTKVMSWISKTSSEGSFCNDLPPKFIGSI